MYSHRDGVLFRHCSGPPEAIEGCVLQWCERGQDQSSHSPIKVQNACGLVLVEPQSKVHVAWKRSKSIFGVVYKAFTLAGNFVMQHGRISFKGATCSRTLSRVASSMAHGTVRVRLQLMVLAMGIGMTLDVRVGCILEKRLGECHWIDVMRRHEELCNVIVFYVTDWSVFRLPDWHPPRTTTVSLTRKGTMTVRMTWNGIDWDENETYYNVTRELASFVRSLI